MWENVNSSQHLDLLMGHLKENPKQHSKIGYKCPFSTRIQDNCFVTLMNSSITIWSWKHIFLNSKYIDQPWSHCKLLMVRHMERSPFLFFQFFLPWPTNLRFETNVSNMSDLYMRNDDGEVSNSQIGPIQYSDYSL